MMKSKKEEKLVASENNDDEERDLLSKQNDSNDDAKKSEKSEHDIEIEKRLNHLKEAMHIRAVENDENSDLKSIYLEGELPNDPKILVSATETETKTEKLSRYPSMKDLNDDEAIILSGKMTISLICLANGNNNNNNNNNHDDDLERNGIVEDHTTSSSVATTNNVA
jgi:hypothetical protein